MLTNTFTYVAHGLITVHISPQTAVCRGLQWHACFILHVSAARMTAGPRRHVTLKWLSIYPRVYAVISLVCGSQPKFLCLVILTNQHHLAIQPLQFCDAWDARQLTAFMFFTDLFRFQPSAPVFSVQHNLVYVLVPLKYCKISGSILIAE